MFSRSWCFVRINTVFSRIYMFQSISLSIFYLLSLFVLTFSRFRSMPSITSVFILIFNSFSLDWRRSSFSVPHQADQGSAFRKLRTEKRNRHAQVLTVCLAPGLKNTGNFIDRVTKSRSFCAFPISSVSSNILSSLAKS